MNPLTRLFTEHPASVGESYWGHLIAAARFSGKLGLAALACVLHALLPFACKTTASRLIDQLHHDMVTHRCKNPEMSNTRTIPGQISG